MGRYREPKIRRDIRKAVEESGVEEGEAAFHLLRVAAELLGKEQWKILYETFRHTTYCYGDDLGFMRICKTLLRKEQEQEPRDIEQREVRREVAKLIIDRQITCDEVIGICLSIVSQVGVRTGRDRGHGGRVEDGSVASPILFVIGLRKGQVMGKRFRVRLWDTVRRVASVVVEARDVADACEVAQEIDLETDLDYEVTKRLEDGFPEASPTDDPPDFRINPKGYWRRVPQEDESPILIKVRKTVRESGMDAGLAAFDLLQVASELLGEEEWERLYDILGQSAYEFLKELLRRRRRRSYSDRFST